MTLLPWDAAPEPKKQRWYVSGRFLPDHAYVDAAQRVAEKVAERKQVSRGTLPFSGLLAVGIQLCLSVKGVDSVESGLPSCPRANPMRLSLPNVAGAG